MQGMTTQQHLTALLCLASALSCAATEEISPVASAEAAAADLSTYTEPLQVMLDIVSQINGHLATVQDEESAEVAGEAIQELLGSLNQAATSFSSLPAPTPEVQAQFDAWFAENEHVMVEMVEQVDRLQQQDPAFFGSQTLIAAIIMVGGVLGGAQ